MPIIIPANSAASGGFEVANSVRFNGGSNDHLKRTLGTATNVKKFTMSWWFKGTGIATGSMFEAASGNVQNGAFVYLKLDDILIDSIVGNSETMKLVPTAHYSDYAAWYHFCLAVDVTLGTAADRNKLYINGERVTSFVTQTNAGQNAARMFNTAIEHLIGIDVYNSGGSLATPFNGYMSEFVFIDGSQEDPTSFGEFDEDSNIWKPIDVSSLTFGNNGFYLNFSNSGNLGEDFSGNDNDFTVVNLAATSQTTDTCTNNFATLNTLDDFYASSTLSEGNLTLVGGGTNASMNATVGLDRGKWYWETRVNDWQGANNSAIGISSEAATATNYEFYNQSGNNTGYGYYSNGSVYGNGGTPASGYGSASGTHIIGVALDLDNNKIAWSYDGTFQGSANPATGANMIAITAPSSLLTGLYFPAFTQKSQTKTFNVNFGNPTFAISSGNADDNNRGKFEYDVPAGFLSLCTANLSEANS